MRTFRFRLTSFAWLALASSSALGPGSATAHPGHVHTSAGALAHHGIDPLALAGGLLLLGAGLLAVGWAHRRID